MPKINRGLSRQRKQGIGKVSVKTKVAKEVASLNKLVKTMDLDEMLEASKAVEMGLREEALPMIKSSKVQNYVERVLALDKASNTRLETGRLQQNLSVEIVRINKKTTNAVEARALYHALMED